MSKMSCNFESLLLSNTTIRVQFCTHNHTGLADQPLQFAVESWGSGLKVGDAGKEDNCCYPRILSVVLQVLKDLSRAQKTEMGLALPVVWTPRYLQSSTMSTLTRCMETGVSGSLVPPHPTSSSLILETLMVLADGSAHSKWQS